MRLIGRERGSSMRHSGWQRLAAELKGLARNFARNAAGNTLAIMAAALIPLCAFAGCSIDMARTSAVKVRLQEACDAGVLAGRKFLQSGAQAGVALTGTALTQANTYFKSNMETSWGGSGWYTNGTDVFSPKTVADSNGVTQVSGTASAVVPMTLMKMFGITSQTVSVSCQARFDTPDTDVMFVLDTTGSMGCAVTDSDAACNSYVGGATTSVQNSDGTTSYYVKEKTSGGQNVSRIDSLRQAVITFYTTVANSADPTTHVRYGFVPYTSTVNAGRLVYGVSPSYFQTKPAYQSRVKTGESSSTSKSYQSGNKQSDCDAYAYTRKPASGYDSSGQATSATSTYGTYKNSSFTGCRVETTTYVPIWTYQSSVQYDVTSYLTGAAVNDPSEVTGATTIWNGCIEERKTSAGTTSFDTSNLPADLDPDLTPTSDDTRWRPMWADVTYPRQLHTGSMDAYSTTTNYASYNDSQYLSAGYMTCPTAAKLLFLPSSTSDISNYVSGLRAIGGTYHDTGMIWGVRMLSPTGIFKANNAWPSGRSQPKRVLVFVTDGQMAPSSSIYGMYGTEYLDRRVTGSTFGTSDPSSSANSDAYTNFHNQRFLAECAKAKASPLTIDVWVVAVAGSQVPDTLKTCASQPSQVLWAQTPAQLTSAFKQIAQQVAMLRVSQ